MGIDSCYLYKRENERTDGGVLVARFKRPEPFTVPPCLILINGFIAGQAQPTRTV